MVTRELGGRAAESQSRDGGSGGFHQTKTGDGGGGAWRKLGEAVRMTAFCESAVGFLGALLLPLEDGVKSSLVGQKNGQREKSWEERLPPISVPQ